MFSTVESSVDTFRPHLHPVVLNLEVGRQYYTRMELIILQKKELYYNFTIKIWDVTC